MKQPVSVHSLDVVDLARTGESRSGRNPLRDFERLARSVRTDREETEIGWAASGERRAASDGVLRPALEVVIEATLPLTCQRCLDRVVVQVQVDRHFVFASTEAEAARLDAESTDDILVLEYPFDLLRLVEDELILALPMVPRHECCVKPLNPYAQSDGFDGGTENARHPFKSLANWKTPGSR